MKPLEKLHTKKKPQAGEKLSVEWGETLQERREASRDESDRDNCKGEHCETAFDKL